MTLFIKEVPLRASSGLAQAAEATAGNAAPMAPVPAAAVSGTPAGESGVQPAATQPPAAAGGSDDPVSQGIPVRGFVRGAESVPVPRAAVTLISPVGRQLGRSVAQADGSYAVDAPDAGSYVLIASADGYQPQTSTILVNDEPVAYDFLLDGMARY